jgi:hypothetical protein
LQQLHEQARQLAEHLRQQQRRLTLRQAELDTRALHWEARRNPARRHQHAQQTAAERSADESRWRAHIRESLDGSAEAGISLEMAPSSSSAARDDEELRTIQRVLGLCERAIGYLESQRRC